MGTGFGQKQILALNNGDAVSHQAQLLHGVLWRIDQPKRINGPGFNGIVTVKHVRIKQQNGFKLVQRKEMPFVNYFIHLESTIFPVYRKRKD